MPKYLVQLGVFSMDEGIVTIMTKVSFGLMVLALLIGAFIILKAMFMGRRAERLATAAAAAAPS